MALHIPIDEIVVAANRQRREFDPEGIVQLADSIARLGLMHPIVVRQFGKARVHLVAGERRLRAIQFLAKMHRPFLCEGMTVVPGLIPCTPLGDLGPVAMYEAELEENTRRKDLTWQEAAQAMARLADLRAMQAEEAGEPPPSPADLAQEVSGRSDGWYQSNVREQLIAAKHMDKPEVAGAQNLKEAIKALKRTEELARSADLAQRVGATFTKASHRLLQGDCVQVLAGLDAAQFDVLLTDPPYGMGADEFGDSGGKAQGAHAYGDDFLGFTRLMDAWIPAVARVLKPACHIYQFCDIDNFGWLKSAWLAAGFKVFRTPLVWAKPNAYRAPWPQHGPQRKYETILYAIRGEKPTRRLAGDVITFPPDENLNHHAQKPVALFTDLLSRSIIAGDCVLDSFCGSGPIYPAAHALKVKATGIELDPAFAGIAAGRIQALE
jgi:DNA modification methylase